MDYLLKIQSSMYKQNLGILILSDIEDTFFPQLILHQIYLDNLTLRKENALALTTGTCYILHNSCRFSTQHIREKQWYEWKIKETKYKLQKIININGWKP